MEISSPAPQPIIVDDYDFHFANGVVMTFSISKDQGDHIDFGKNPLAVELHFAEKPSATDPDGATPSEDITVLMQHVILVAHRTRAITPPTREERDLFKQSLIKMSNTIQ